MPIDITPLKNFAEGEMVDNVTIYRNHGDEGPLDQWTGTVEPAPADTVYSGKGLVAPINAYPNQTPEGQGIASYVRYNLLVPVACPVLEINDVIVVNTCRWDAKINGSEFVVESVDRSTFQVARQAQITNREVAGQITPFASEGTTVNVSTVSAVGSV